MSEVVLPTKKGDVIKIDGVCYEFLEWTADPATADTDEEYDTCEECYGSSSADVSSAEVSSAEVSSAEVEGSSAGTTSSAQEPVPEGSSGSGGPLAYYRVKVGQYTSAANCANDVFPSFQELCIQGYDGGPYLFSSEVPLASLGVCYYDSLFFDFKITQQLGGPYPDALCEEPSGAPSEESGQGEISSETMDYTIMCVESCAQFEQEWLGPYPTDTEALEEGPSAIEAQCGSFCSGATGDTCEFGNIGWHQLSPVFIPLQGFYLPWYCCCQPSSAPEEVSSDLPEEISSAQPVEESSDGGGGEGEVGKWYKAQFAATAVWNDSDCSGVLQAPAETCVESMGGGLFRASEGPLSGISRFVGECFFYINTENYYVFLSVDLGTAYDSNLDCINDL